MSFSGVGQESDPRRDAYGCMPLTTEVLEYHGVMGH